MGLRMQVNPERRWSGQRLKRLEGADTDLANDLLQVSFKSENSIREVIAAYRDRKESEGKKRPPVIRTVKLACEYLVFQSAYNMGAVLAIAKATGYPAVVRYVYQEVHGSQHLFDELKEPVNALMTELEMKREAGNEKAQ